VTVLLAKRTISYSWCTNNTCCCCCCCCCFCCLSRFIFILSLVVILLNQNKSVVIGNWKKNIKCNSLSLHGVFMLRMRCTLEEHVTNQWFPPLLKTNFIRVEKTANLFLAWCTTFDIRRTQILVQLLYLTRCGVTNCKSFWYFYTLIRLIYAFNFVSQKSSM
jgi:hypothetical protein